MIERTRDQIRGSCARTHQIFGSVKPVSAGFATNSINRLAPTRSVIARHSSSVRWSHQISAGRNTSPAASSSTKPCICPLSPTARTSAPVAPASVKHSATATQVARHQSLGSCSAQPNSGDAISACSAVAAPSTRPASSTSTARVPPVPTSIPKSLVAILRRLPSSNELGRAILVLLDSKTNLPIRRKREILESLYNWIFANEHCSATICDNWARVGSPARPGMVRPPLRYPHRAAITGLAAYPRRQDHANLRPHRLRQDPRRISDLHRLTGSQSPVRRSDRRHRSTLRLATQSPQQRHSEKSRDPAR